MVWAVALEANRLLFLPTYGHVSWLRSPRSDLPQDHHHCFGGAAVCGDARRRARAGTRGVRRRIVLLVLPGILRELLQEKPGPGQMPGPAATLPRRLHPAPALGLSAHP